MRRSRALIRDYSTLNVRILTRSPLARVDFDLFKSFGSRLSFGMSLPTLRNDPSKICEPKAPARSQRLATLHTAREAWRCLEMAFTQPRLKTSNQFDFFVAVLEINNTHLFTWHLG
jgi:hypothetical protein